MKALLRFTVLALSALAVTFGVALGQDSTAVADSLRLYGQLHEVIAGGLPFLTPENASNLASLITSLILAVPVLAAVGLSGWGLRLIATLTPVLRAQAWRLERWSGLINPLLAFVLAWALTGNWMLGGVAGTVWAAARSVVRKGTPAAVAKAKATVALLAVLACAALPASAGPIDVVGKSAASTLSFMEKNLGLAVGAGYHGASGDWSNGLVDLDGFWGFQVGVTPGISVLGLTPSVRVRQTWLWDGGAPGTEASVWFSR